MECGIAGNADLIYTSRMGRPRNIDRVEPWPKRARFVEILDGRLAAGATYEEIAEALGLASTRSLEQEFRTTRRPGRGTLERAAAYFGVDIWEIECPEGDDEFGNIMGILGKNLTPEMRDVMIQMAKAGQTKGRERLSSEAVQDPSSGSGSFVVRQATGSGKTKFLEIKSAASDGPKKKAKSDKH